MMLKSVDSQQQPELPSRLSSHEGNATGRTAESAGASGGAIARRPLDSIEPRIDNGEDIART